MDESGTRRGTARRFSVWLGVGVSVGAVLALGCRGPKQNAKMPVAEAPLIVGTEKSKSSRLTVVELQSDVMGLADGFCLAVAQAGGDLMLKMESPEDRAAVLAWNVGHATAATVLASGPNPVVNLLDEVGLITLSRMVMEEYWMAQRFGDRAKPLLEVHRFYEQQAWNQAGQILDSEQQKQLRELILAWRQNHPDQRYVSFVSISDYAKERWRSPTGRTGYKSSLFGLLYLDPLSSLDPATRQIAQTRQFAERLMYYMQRMPGLVRMQAELMFQQAMANPQMQKVTSSLEEFQTTARQMGQTVQDFPAQLAAEQKKVLDQVFEEEAKLSRLSAELKETFVAGAAMAEAVNRAAQSVEHFTTSVKPDPNKPRPADRRPFDILDYATTAEEIGRMATNLALATESLQSLIDSPAWASRSGDAQELVGQLEVSGQTLADRVFWRGLLLVGVFLAGLALILAVYRATGSKGG